MQHCSDMRDLVVSEERARWIFERYPFADVGRPGILVSDNMRSGVAAESDVRIEHEEPADALHREPSEEPEIELELAAD